MKKICFIASSGGHFEQLMMLKPLMKKYDSLIVTEKTNYSVSNSEFNTYYLHQVNRREKSFIFRYNVINILGFVWAIYLIIINIVKSFYSKTIDY